MDNEELIPYISFSNLLIDKEQRLMDSWPKVNFFVLSFLTFDKLKFVNIHATVFKGHLLCYLFLHGHWKSMQKLMPEKGLYIYMYFLLRPALRRQYTLVSYYEF